MARSTMEVVRYGRTLGKRPGQWREKVVLPEVRLADGTRLSVQASDMHYCTPRHMAGPYSTVEVWFPGEREPQGYVSVERLETYIAAHGGEVE